DALEATYKYASYGLSPASLRSTSVPPAPASPASAGVLASVCPASGAPSLGSALGAASALGIAAGALLKLAASLTAAGLGLNALTTPKPRMLPRIAAPMVRGAATRSGISFCRRCIAAQGE